VLPAMAGPPFDRRNADAICGFLSDELSETAALDEVRQLLLSRSREATPPDRLLWSNQDLQQAAEFVNQLLNLVLRKLDWIALRCGGLQMERRALLYPEAHFSVSQARDVA
jgi:hypothetical protein